MNEAREKAINQIYAEHRKLWHTGDALYPHKDTLRLGYDAGYDSRDAEVEKECKSFARWVETQDLRWKYKSLDALWQEYREEAKAALSSGTQENEDEK